MSNFIDFLLVISKVTVPNIPPFPPVGQICRVVEWHRGTQRWTCKERLAWQRVEVTEGIVVHL